MASLRDADITTSYGGQGVMTVLKLTACVTGDTVTYKNPVKAWIPINETTTDAITASYSPTTQLFTITVANTPDIALIIVH